MNVFPLSEHGVDLIVGLVALEALVVICWRGMFQSGPAPLAFVVNLLAGAFLLLALRCALAGSSQAAIAVCLSAALVAHLADLRLRWQGAAAKQAAPLVVLERASMLQPTTGNVTAIAQASPKAAPIAPTRGSRVRE
jgi:predicted component of type VI protein secretion system